MGISVLKGLLEMQEEVEEHMGLFPVYQAYGSLEVIALWIKFKITFIFEEF